MIQVPGYIIKREIGSGGMATVYLAEQTSLEREVALKVMNAQLASDPNFSRRFLQEARTLASLSHPNIVAVYDVGVTDAGLNYFSMQHLPGGDLMAQIHHGISEAELLPILAGVARALGYAHQRGFVHRDVSPANVMFDAGGSPILTDFGIARAVSRGSSRLTNSGVSVGTSFYMSPEQARGGEVDARSDIYSLGATIFEALTGKPPYEGEDGFAIAYAHVFEPIPKLPPKFTHWQPLLDKSLAKDPRERFQDMDQFTAALVALGAPAPQPATTLTMPRPAALQQAATVAMPLPSAAAVAAAQGASTVQMARPAAVDAASTVQMARPAAAVAPAPAAPPAPAPAQAATVAMQIPITAESAAVDPAKEAADALERPTVYHMPAPSTPAPAAVKRGLPWPLIVSGAGLAVLLAAGFAYWRSQHGANADAAVKLEQRALQPQPPAPAPAPAPAPVEPAPAPVDAGVATATPSDAAPPVETPPTDASNPQPPTGDDLTTLPIDPKAEALALANAVATTAIDPLADQLARAQAELAKQKGSALPNTKALDRYKTALKLATKFKAQAEIEKSKQGILGIAQAYEDAAEKRLAENKLDEYLDASRKGEEVARGLLPDGADIANRIAAKRASLRDEALASAKKAAAAWDRNAALAAYDRALKVDPGNAEAQKGRKAVEHLGEVGSTFKDAADAPLMVVASVGGKKLAVAQTETTLAEYRKYWTAQGAKTRGAKTTACRDRESFFRSSKARTFEAPFDKPEQKQDGDHPVVCVSWDDAADFAKWLSAQTGKSYRLPRASEFESLARSAKSGVIAAAGTARVKSLEADGNGLYDIAGNVREWVGDCAGSCKAHIAMGSAWLSAADKADPAQRENFDNDLSLNSVGFRVVRDVE